MRASDLQKALRKEANPERAKLSARYFKTGKGEYGEGDVFLGLTVPQQRAIARGFYDMSLADIAMLLKSPVHEDRFTALVILVEQSKRSSENDKAKIARFYLKNARRINNWDLVDTSAPQILGPVVTRAMLVRLASSRNLWERRIAILATFYGIARGEFTDALAIAEWLLKDPHDLIHKAVGWMLREIGKRDRVVLERFLAEHASGMPRTMLRYAIERFTPAERKRYMTSA